MPITETYRSQNYKPEDVTGKYVRVEGLVKRGFKFKVFETVTGKRGPGSGPTFIEYITTGEELPEELKQKCIKSKVTERWM